MHMADALISPVVGGTMWVVSAATIVYCSKKVKEDFNDRKLPLMGVLGAFIFAAQMINFTIPATGSSGHLGGGLILAILLGPYAAFLTIASVLVVQALMFADGGLLALGCNIFNLGIFPAFVAYPLIYKLIIKNDPSPVKITVAAMIAAVAGLELGAFCVVMETALSGISELPFKTFILLMLPIHLAIGIVEGLVTSAVINFVWKADPGILRDNTALSKGRLSVKQVSVIFIFAALVTGGLISWFASSQPDGLEWSLAKVTGKESVETKSVLHEKLAALQEKIAVLPDYSFKKTASEKASQSALREGTSVSGIAGGLLTLALVFIIGFLIRKAAKPQENRNSA